MGWCGSDIDLVVNFSAPAGLVATFVCFAPVCVDGIRPLWNARVSSISVDVSLSYKAHYMALLRLRLCAFTCSEGAGLISSPATGSSSSVAEQLRENLNDGESDDGQGRVETNRDFCKSTRGEFYSKVYRRTLQPRGIDKDSAVIYHPFISCVPLIYFRE